MANSVHSLAPPRGGGSSGRYGAPVVAWGLRTTSGARKYLTPQERHRFMNAAAAQPATVRTLCLMLAHTGCRLSEALALTVADVELDEQLVAIRCLKKRKRKNVIRLVPLPPAFLRLLADIHADAFASEDGERRLWPWGRTRAWQLVKAVMRAAQVTGCAATPKGLRHGFGVNAVLSGAPLTLVQKWLGHASITTTAIYTDIIGHEERAMAKRMWSGEGLAKM